MKPYDFGGEFDLCCNRAVKTVIHPSGILFCFLWLVVLLLSCRAPAAKWSPRPPVPSPGARISASPRPTNDGGRRSPRPAVGGGVSPSGRLSPAGGRASPISGRASPVGQGPSPAKIVADAHAAQVQRQKALAAQQAQRQQARVALEQERERLNQVNL